VVWRAARYHAGLVARHPGYFLARQEAHWQRASDRFEVAKKPPAYVDSNALAREGRLKRACRGNAMNIYDEPKIDCHNHVIDPARFPYAADTAYRPAGQEIGNAAYFLHVLDAYGVRHALVVGPNSGYGTSTR
jgi:hypothetical protein